MAEGNASTQEISSLERVWLGLVFGGPMSAWLTMARIMRVQVDADSPTGESRFADAEAGAQLAARWFPYGLAATALAVASFFAWSPVQTRLMEPVMHTGFHAVAADVLAKGGPDATAMAVATGTMVAMGLVAGVTNAIVFGLLPLVVLRRSTLAAAPAVSVALARKAGSLELRDFEAYPRLSFAVETILGPRRRPRP